MITVRQFMVGGYDQNLSYLLVDSESQEAFVVDPAGDLTGLFATVEKESLRVKGVVVTHTHFDHVEHVPQLRQKFRVPVYVYEAGIMAMGIEHTVAVREGDHLKLGEYCIDILYTPGHNIDSMCLFVAAKNSENKAPLLVSGDTLFVNGCGRTNGAQAHDLFNSLQRLKKLPPETIIYPGHDYGDTPTSTIVVEKAQNKYLTAPDLETFKERRLG